MITNPTAIPVLCFGDSNTYGQRSDDVNKGRWPADVRWTGQLQDLLGDNFYVIEEGLSSRTTDLEYAKKPGRNGKTYLLPCIQSHNPLGIIVLMLGTNDLKIGFNRSVDDIAAALGQLMADVKEYAQNTQGETPHVILVSPIHINDTKPLFHQLYDEHYNQESVEKSKLLAETVKPIATKYNSVFVDASVVAEPGDDGIHFSRESHDALAKLLAKTVADLSQTHMERA